MISITARTALQEQVNMDAILLVGRDDSSNGLHTLISAQSKGSALCFQWLRCSRAMTPDETRGEWVCIDLFFEERSLYLDILASGLLCRTPAPAYTQVRTIFTISCA